MRTTRYLSGLQRRDNAPAAWIISLVHCVTCPVSMPPPYLTWLLDPSFQARSARDQRRGQKLGVTLANGWPSTVLFFSFFGRLPEPLPFPAFKVFELEPEPPTTAGLRIHSLFARTAARTSRSPTAPDLSGPFATSLELQPDFDDISCLYFPCTDLFPCSLQASATLS